MDSTLISYMKTQRIPSIKRIIKAYIVSIALLCPIAALADAQSALALMEDQTNPLVELNTSQGTLYIELFVQEAPRNVAQILALMAGEVELIDGTTGTAFNPLYYNGMIFHKAIPGFLIQTGSPYLSPIGAPAVLLQDEINASALGLGSERVIGPDGGTNPLLNIVSQEDFTREILLPVYRDMNITSGANVLEKQDAIITQLKNMTINGLYELQGYRYLDDRFSHSNLRGTVSLANTGGNSNGPEFFINLNDAPWLDGKHTVVGAVVEGFSVVEAIGSIELLAIAPSRLSTVIYSARRVH